MKMSFIELFNEPIDTCENSLCRGSRASLFPRFLTEKQGEYFIRETSQECLERSDFTHNFRNFPPRISFHSRCFLPFFSRRRKGRENKESKYATKELKNEKKGEGINECIVRGTKSCLCFAEGSEEIFAGNSSGNEIKEDFLKAIMIRESDSLID